VISLVLALALAAPGAPLEAPTDAGMPLRAETSTAPDAGAPTIELPRFTPRADAFSEFSARFAYDGPDSTTFSVPRVQLGLDAEWYGATGRVLVEGAYATAGGALIGVSGDSVVVRLREAWAGYRFHFLEARLGLVPTLLIPELERGFRHRELTADGLELHRFLAPADFGGTLRVEFPAEFGWAGVAVTNGEGYTSRELNDGKNVELTTLVRPLTFVSKLRPLELVGSASFGSAGLPAVATQRLGGGVQWSTAVLGVGVSAFYARGLLADPSREGALVEGFARAMLFEHLLLAGRVTWFKRSLAGDDAQLETIVSAGGTVAFVEAFVAWVRTMTFGEARTALPGIDAHELRVVARFRWPEWIP
jgi:hypothetical protein